MTRDPRAQLEAAGNEFKAARTSVENTRQALRPLIVKALNAGVPQVEIARLSGYTRESIRTIARENGIEARP